MIRKPPEWWAGEEFCYLTTTGGRKGRPHEIEIWFGVYDGRVIFSLIAANALTG